MLLEKYKNIKVLCIEDEEFIRENQVDYLKRFFSTVYEASDAQEGLKIIETIKPDLVITDIEMLNMSGLEMVRLVRKEDKKTKFIVLSAYSNKEYLLDAIDLGLVKYLIKPIDHETFYPILIECANEIIKENSTLIKITNSCIFDVINSLVKFDNQTFSLSKYEADFLMLLHNNKANVVTYEQIQYEVWVDNIMTDTSLRTLVKALRKKLPENIMKNLSKVGYKLEENI